MRGDANLRSISDMSSSASRSGIRTLQGYRFSAFWLRSKCSICSYQLNIWYVLHWGTTILNWFLELDIVLGACSAFVTSRPGIAVLPGVAHFINKPKNSWNPLTCLVVFLHILVTCETSVCISVNITFLTVWMSVVCVKQYWCVHTHARTHKYTYTCIHRHACHFKRRVLSIALM